jgi:hypothetical protein
MEENVLDSLSNKYNTDKKSSVHNYTEIYWELFKDKPKDVKNFLEIGVLNGSSLKVWKDFFTEAQIKAIDINSYCKKFEEDRVKISIGPQENYDFLKSEFLDKNLNFDVIIDDGSHISDHQIKSFEFLFVNCLTPGGIYVIEDVCCSYWESHGGGYKNNDSCIEYFKKKIDEINFYGSVKNNVLDRNKNHMLKNYENPTVFQRQIKKITFANSLIIIEKEL